VVFPVERFLVINKGPENARENLGKKKRKEESGRKEGRRR